MKIFRILVIIFLLFLPAFSFAQVIINEIMYDPPEADSGREWIEIYNSGSSSVDIVGWKFLENSTASNHGLTQIQGTTNLSAGDFVVIVVDSEKFLNDWPGFSGNLFRAAFSSLNNTNATVIIKDKELVIQNQFSYTSELGAKGDGNSLQRTNTGWISAPPTPGVANSSISNTTSTTDATTTTVEVSSNTTSSSQTNNSSSNVSAHSSPAPLSDTEETIQFEISAGRNRLAAVGNNLVFVVTPTKAQNIPESGITYFWSFGDGAIAQGKSVNHSYKFAGDYSVVVTASCSDKQAVSRTEVKVVSPKIWINKVLEGLEISNDSREEINLDGWKLVSEKKTFIFPADTLIPGGKKVVFADDLTKISDQTVQLLNPLNKEISFFKKIEVDNSLEQIQTEIDEIKKVVAQIQPKSVEQTNLIQGLALDEEKSTEEEINFLTTLESSDLLEENLNQADNTAVVFEAVKQKGFVSRLFAWPIKGIDFIRRLFVEE